MTLPIVLVLAGGRGTRFAASGGVGSKLDALLHGKPLLQHVMDAVAAAGLPYYVERSGQPGMGDSIAHAVRATRHAAGWMVLPGDLPLLRGDTLRGAAEAWACAPRQALRPRHAGLAAHPVVFPRAARACLCALRGEAGARAVLEMLAARGRLQEWATDDDGAMADVDTVNDLQALHAARPVDQPKFI